MKREGERVGRKKGATEAGRAAKEKSEGPSGDYFLTLKAAVKTVASHMILISPLPSGVLPMLMVS